MSEKPMTGASDWRSEQEKEKSYLRTGCMSLFKTWIPEHPEAAVERDALAANMRQAFGTHGRVTFVSTLSTGVDDVMVHEYHDQPLSMQELLVQREGTEAFLDPRNALRVVRRKYGMMTLITRLTGALEHRNIVAVSIAREVEPRELLDLSKLISARIVDTAAEEEQTFRKGFAKLQFPHVEILFHTDIVGRRIPVPWEVKQAYALAGRTARSNAHDATTSARRALISFAPRLSAKALKQLALYARDLNAELDQPGLDPATDLLTAAAEERLLTATRSLFDEYQEARRAATHTRALGQATPAEDNLINHAGDFLADAEAAAGPGAEDEMLRQARALDRIRTLRGREFFSRISMVSGDVDFESAARVGAGFEDVERTMATLDPMEAIKAARKVLEPYFRAKALAAACVTLAALGREVEAIEAANEALAAARQAHGSEVGPAYSAALQALLAARSEKEAMRCLQEAIEHAHQIKDLEERASGLMRVVSSLMEAGPLPASVKTNLSRHILSNDIHFWGKPCITSALVEAIVSLLPGPDDDTVIFLQKVVGHPTVEVRCSVIRTMPISDSPALRNMLLSHLKDKDATVRIEVMERIGWAADRAMSLYLVNHARHAQELAGTKEEKRSLALNLGRLDGERHLPIYNAFLGHLSTDGPGLTDKVRPFKDDPDWQLAGLEVLFHLNGRNARKLIFTAAEKAKKRKSVLADVAAKCWGAVKSRPYGDPTFPRSPHDPAWTEADQFDLDEVLARAAPQLETADETPDEEPQVESEPAPGPVAQNRGSAVRAVSSTFVPPKEGLFSRLKRKLLGGGEDPGDSVEAPAATERRGRLGPEATGERLGKVESLTDMILDDEVDLGTTRATVDGPAHAALRFEGSLSDGGVPLNGSVSLAFSVYDREEAPAPVWRETLESVRCNDGGFSVHLGLETRLPAELPNVVWLGLSVEGRDEMMPRTKLSRARTVVQG